MADDLALRVGGLEAVVRQLSDTMARQTELLERVVRLEERSSAMSDTVAELKAEVSEAAKGVTAAGPWVSVAQKGGLAIVTALGTAVAAWVAVKFGLTGR